MHHLKSISVLLILTIVFFVGCKKKEQQPAPSPSNNTNHIEYFGFTLIDTYYDDPLDAEVKTNYSDEVYEFCNMADILVLEPEDNIQDKLNAMMDFDMKSLLHLHDMFFEYIDDDAPSGANYGLREDYQARWDSFVAVNNLAENDIKIQGFYVGEEPTWNGISYEDLKAACDYLKLTVPEVPVMVIEAHPVVNDIMVPQSVDWLGFDHYLIADPKNSEVFLAELNTIKSKRSTPDQKIVLVLDAHYIDWAHGDLANLTPEDMKGVATSYYELGLSDESVVAIVGYLWPGGFDDINALGARQLPSSVQDEYQRIGKEITGKN